MARQLDDEDYDKLTSEELSATTTGSGRFSRLQAEEWLDQVVLDAEPRRRLLELSREFDELVDSGDRAITVPRTNKALDMSGEHNKDEAVDRNFTEMDTLDGERVEIEDDDWYEGGLKISKQKVMTTPVDVAEVARHHLAEQIARDVDEALRDEAIDAVSEIESDDSDLSDSEDLHLLTDADEGHQIDQTESGRLTPDSIAEAAARIEANNWEPFALVIDSDHKKDLRTDSQFTNAAEYGSDDVVLNGEIGMYLGIRVVVSNTIEGEAIMVGREQETGADVAQALVWKEEPEVNHVFDFEDNTHRFYYDQAFKPATIQPTALATIQTE